MCPNCNKHSRCGCKSCEKREGKYEPIRPHKLKGDFIICPYCRVKFHYDTWESFNYENYLKNK